MPNLSLRQSYAGEGVSSDWFSRVPISPCIPLLLQERSSLRSVVTWLPCYRRAWSPFVISPDSTSENRRGRSPEGSHCAWKQNAAYASRAARWKRSGFTDRQSLQPTSALARADSPPHRFQPPIASPDGSCPHPAATANLSASGGYRLPVSRRLWI